VHRECERKKVVTDSTNVVIFKTWYARMLTSKEQLSIQFYDWVRHSLKLKTQLKKHPRVFPEKHDIDSTEAFFTACEKLHVINTASFGNLETVPPWHGITSMFSFGTGLSDQEWHSITVTTSLLSVSSPYQLLSFNRNGSPLERKEVRMVAL